jgi:hypothetical protein
VSDPITSQDREVLHAEVMRLEAEHASVNADTREVEVALRELAENRQVIVNTRARHRAMRRTLVLTGAFVLVLAGIGIARYLGSYVTPETLRGRVSSVRGSVPLEMGEPCSARLDSSFAGPFNAQVVIACGDLPLYGGGSYGYFDCESENDHATICNDPWSVDEDGDAAVWLDRDRNRLIVRDGRRWRVGIQLTE